jgi:6-phosphofructokinase 2
MEEVNAAAKKSLQRVEPKLWLFLQPQGAVLVTKDSYDYVPAPNVAKSTVGAGDSMVVE